MMERKMLLAALALLLLSGAVFAQGSIWDLGNSVTSSPISCEVPQGKGYEAWIGLSWLLLLVGAIAYAGIMALNGVLSTQKYEASIRGHLWATVESAAMLAILSIAFLGLQNFGVNAIDSARAYSVVIRNTVTMDFALVVIGNTGISFASRQVIPIKFIAGARVFGLSFQMAPMFRPIFDGLGTVAQLISVAILEWTGHEFVLCFIKNSMLTFLMPTGFFLRTFGIRGGGNALIGLAIALYFVYPYLMVRVGEMLNNYFYKVVGDGKTNPIWCVGGAPKAGPNEAYIINGNEMLSAKRIIGGDIPLYVIPTGISTFGLGVPTSGPVCFYNTPFSSTYGTMVEAFKSISAWGFAAGGAVGVAVLSHYFNLSWLTLALSPLLITFLFYGLYEMVFFFFVVGVVLPIMLIFVTITLAKEITKALGTEMDLSALEKLI